MNDQIRMQNARREGENARGVWKPLSNGHLPLDALAFGEEPPRRAAMWPGLRVVRVRAGDDGETPEWYAQSGGEQAGLSEGLFRSTERVFASTTPKPPSFRKISHQISRLTPWVGARGPRGGL